MKSEPPLLGQMGMSIGGESIPFTMQAEARHMTIDEAVASGLFDAPDEPGMVRIPISVSVMVPWHLLQPPEAGPDQDPADDQGSVPSGAPGSSPGRRFGTYPRGIAAQNVMDSFKSQMSPAAVAPVAGLPAAVAAAAGHGAGPSAATAAADGSGGLLDAGAQAELRGLALTAGRGAVVAGPLGAAALGALWPKPVAKADRPLAMRELAEPKPRVDTGGLAGLTGLDDTRARQGNGPGSLDAERDEGSAFTATAPSGRLQGTSVPAPLPPLPGLTPPEPLPPLAGFTPGSTPIHTTPGAPLDRPFLADAQVHIAPEVGAASNILERNELGRRMEEAGTVAPGEVAHHIVPGGARQSGGRDPEPAQKALSDLGVDLHEPANGVGLSAGFHNKIHTFGYYDEINRRLFGVESRERAEGILQELEQDLKQADSDYQQTGDLPKWIRKKK